MVRWKGLTTCGRSLFKWVRREREPSLVRIKLELMKVDCSARIIPSLISGAVSLPHVPRQLIYSSGENVRRRYSRRSVLKYPQFAE